jgi:hypothetical protein
MDPHEPDDPARFDEWLAAAVVSMALRALILVVLRM